MNNLVERLRARDGEWQLQCDRWLAKAREGIEVDAEQEGVVRRTLYAEAADKLERQARAIDELKADVIAFAGPWAARYAEMYELPKGALHPVHYDLLEKCGARMDDFTRANLRGDDD